MIQDLTADNSTELRPIARVRSQLLARAARQLLSWEPVGSIVVELPTSQRIRFGRSSGGSEPLLKLNNYKVVYKALCRGTVGFAEAYMSKDIECSDLTGLFRFFVKNRDRFMSSGKSLFRVRLADRIAHISRRNSRQGAKRNISEHYDLGNDFYRHWLDDQMVYSSGLFKDGATTLSHAQQHKIDRILAMLDLKENDEVLEIGCGWGAFALRAAKKHEANVTALTLSQEQLRYAEDLAMRERVTEACQFRLQDYRDVGESFDHVVSIEMMEAVGEAYWPRYFETISGRLRAGGSAVLQVITLDEAYFDDYRRSADFIQRYVFPGGMLPTQRIIADQATAAGLGLERVELFGQCYARTLQLWRERFHSAWPQIERLGFDDRFRRLWHYYLTYCEAGFAEGMIDVGIYQLRKL